jgi:hypothetical protein
VLRILLVVLLVANLVAVAGVGYLVYDTRSDVDAEIDDARGEANEAKDEFDSRVEQLERELDAKVVPYRDALQEICERVAGIAGRAPAAPTDSGAVLAAELSAACTEAGIAR